MPGEVVFTDQPAVIGPILNLLNLLIYESMNPLLQWTN